MTTIAAMTKPPERVFAAQTVQAGRAIDPERAPPASATRQSARGVRAPTQPFWVSGEDLAAYCAGLGRREYLAARVGIARDEGCMPELAGILAAWLRREQRAQRWLTVPQWPVYTLIARVAVSEHASAVRWGDQHRMWLLGLSDGSWSTWAPVYRAALESLQRWEGVACGHVVRQQQAGDAC